MTDKIPTPPRVALIMVEEIVLDNLIYAKENMEKVYKLKIENVSDAISTLLNYWFEGKRE